MQLKLNKVKLNVRWFSKFRLVSDFSKLETDVIDSVSSECRKTELMEPSLALRTLANEQ
jgi:hypothetical protein